jgi:hypothetical protein
MGARPEASMAEHCIRNVSEKGDDLAWPRLLLHSIFARSCRDGRLRRMPSKQGFALGSCKDPKTQITECREQKIKTPLIGQTEQS